MPHADAIGILAATRFAINAVGLPNVAGKMKIAIVL
jgi:hypothetical protein